MASSNTSFWDKPAAQAHYLDNKQKTQSPGLSGIYKQAVEVGYTTSGVLRILACSTVTTEESKAALESVSSHLLPSSTTCSTLLRDKYQSESLLAV
jgi:hypothetical protein